MHRLLPAPLAKLFELNFTIYFFLIFTAPIICAFADGAIQLYEFVLRHIVETYTIYRQKSNMW